LHADWFALPAYNNPHDIRAADDNFAVAENVGLDDFNLDIRNHRAGGTDFFAWPMA